MDLNWDADACVATVIKDGVVLDVTTEGITNFDQNTFLSINQRDFFKLFGNIETDFPCMLFILVYSGIVLVSNFIEIAGSFFFSSDYNLPQKL